MFLKIELPYILTRDLVLARILKRKKTQLARQSLPDIASIDIFSGEIPGGIPEQISGNPRWNT